MDDGPSLPRRREAGGEAVSGGWKAMICFFVFVGLLGFGGGKRGFLLKALNSLKLKHLNYFEALQPT